MTTAKPDFQPDEMRNLKRMILMRIAVLPFAFGALFLIPAGTFRYWQVYLYFATLLAPMVYVISYFMKNDPRFLARRMKMKEKQAEQKKIILFAYIPYLAGFLIPGFDHRFGWSDVPVYWVIFADLMVLLSYLLVIRVFKENSYASHIVEVEKGQVVISTGPYGVVRHPMYTGILVMMLATPVALGSWWALIAFSMMPFVFVLRIQNEEKVLSEQLPGYQDYCRKVRYRLIPFLW
jgi:protein-S-isoprenylcysteine O-methyltransferase Ste14